jgi:hypothetical protein
MTWNLSWQFCDVSPGVGVPDGQRLQVPVDEGQRGVLQIIL